MQLVSYELVTRGHAPLSVFEAILLLPHVNWNIETAANMIIQLRLK